MEVVGIIYSSWRLRRFRYHAANLAARVNQGEVGQLTVAVLGPADAQIFIDIFRLFAKLRVSESVSFRAASRRYG